MPWSTQGENTRSVFLSIGDMSGRGVFSMVEIEQEGSNIYVQ